MVEIKVEWRLVEPVSRCPEGEVLERLRGLGDFFKCDMVIGHKDVKKYGVLASKRVVEVGHDVRNYGKGETFYVYVTLERPKRFFFLTFDGYGADRWLKDIREVSMEEALRKGEELKKLMREVEFGVLWFDKVLEM